MRRLIPAGDATRPVEFVQDTLPAPSPSEVLVKAESCSPDRGARLRELGPAAVLPGEAVPTIGASR
ncbi:MULTISPECIES: hypothetical protein [unclassified Nonomuraea]|uniref:hypothetical protein n=1 Tax=unclassified Nonomuraea TaxID=2593643 RepID=UPI0033DF8AAF